MGGLLCEGNLFSLLAYDSPAMGPELNYFVGSMGLPDADFTDNY